MKKLSLLFIFSCFILVNIAYWQDPWLWRRFFNTLGQIVAPTEHTILQPNEAIGPADAVFYLPINDDQRTIKQESIGHAIDFVKQFDTYAFVVVHRGAIQAEWYADGWNKDSLTQSQSMHKSIVALLIGAALESGKIDSINDPIAKYIDEWEGDERGAITIHQLMIMSSGLEQYKFKLNPFTDDFKWLYSGNSIGPALRNPKAGWQPGEKFDYNNINAELLGLVIERSTGQRYADYLREQLWQKMGGEEALVWIDSENGDAFTSCCLMAKAVDWAKLGIMMLNEGEINGQRIVAKDWIRKMITQSSVSPWYGLQTWLAYPTEINPRSRNPFNSGAYARTEEFLANDVYYFSGRGAQRVYVVPSHELVIVRLGPALGRNPLKPGWDNSFLVNTMIRGIQLVENH